MTSTLLGVVGLAFVGLFLVAFVLPPRDVEAELIAEYLALARGSRAQALEDLDERLRALGRRNPGKSRAWLLRWLVTDLQRAKR